MTNASDDGPLKRLLAEGAITEAQLGEAKAFLRGLEAGGQSGRPLTEILVELGYLEADRLEQVLSDEHAVGASKRIAGFELIQEIGKGSVGVVYKAKQVSLDRIVALKVLDPDLAKDASYVHQFLDEARAVARLSHTNLISGIDVGEENGVPYLAMEYADGVTLARVLRRGGAMDEARALLVATQLARALEYAHKNDLVHGEVRPENVIITGDGVTKLCDLGQARKTAVGPEDTGWGTGDYTSPEQLRGVEGVGPEADLYALGCVLFHMLAGESPFHADSRKEVVMRHLTEEAPPVRDRDPEISEATGAIVGRLLHKRPADRFVSAADLLEAFDGATKGLKTVRGVSAPPPSGTSGGGSTAPGGAGGPVRRRRRRR